MASPTSQDIERAEEVTKGYTDGSHWVSIIAAALASERERLEAEITRLREALAYAEEELDDR